MIAPAPDRPWAVPNTASYSAVAAGCAEAAPSPSPDAAGPPEVVLGKGLRPAELIDIAQRTNPDTRIAWEGARQAAIGVGIAESVYAPMLSAQAVAAVQRVPAPLPKTVLSPNGFFVADTQFFLPALTLEWLLFDSGGKEATIDATKQAVDEQTLASTRCIKRSSST